MSWSYSGNPNDSEKDAVRFFIGDTDSDEPLMQDEEIEFVIENNSNIYSAAAELAFSLVAKFSTLAQESKIGPISENYSNRADNYMKVAKRLEQKAASKSAVKFVCGGVSTVDAQPASFFIGMHDFTSRES